MSDGDLTTEAQNMDFTFLDLFRIGITENFGIQLEFSLVIVILVVVFIAIFIRSLRTKHFKLVELEISLGSIGKAKLQPNYTDIQIAHKIWTELVTRKAAIKIDPEHDVISEVYDSWYALFGRIRELISEIPAEKIRKEESTQKLVDIATRALNDGLRPHLTKWQARFRNWYQHQEMNLKKASPQEIQMKFPDYKILVAEMLDVNNKLIEFSKELKKISEGKVSD